jgi:hypothetical protein
MAAKVIPFPRVACNASTPPSVLPDGIFPPHMPKTRRDKWQRLMALLDGWPPEEREQFMRYMYRRIMMARNR